MSSDCKGFSSLKRGRNKIKAGIYMKAGVFLLSPGRDANPSQGYPQH